MATTITTGELSERIGGRLDGSPDIVLHGINKIEEAQAGEVTFLSNPRYLRFATTTQASCILVAEDFHSETTHPALIIVANPYQAFLHTLQFFFPPLSYPEGFRHSSAQIHPSAQIHDTAYIGAGVIVGEQCVIEEKAVLLPNVVLYPSVQIGPGTILHAQVVCYDHTRIGTRCILHAGAVIGSDGFGFVEQQDKSYEKIPQVGNVVIGDDVEIGANTCIDRATMGSTVIHNGVKLDNLVHIAHNVVVGEYTAIAAQAGISGSTHIGKRNRIAGQAGFIGHIHTADDVIVIAQSGVSKALTDKGRYFGAPAKDFMTAVREEAALRQLPSLLAEFRAMQQTIEQLKEHISGTATDEDHPSA